MVGTDALWQIISVGEAHRGLTDDTADDGLKKDKLLHLTGMLEEIAQ